VVKKAVEIELSEFTDDELQEECERRDIWPEEPPDTTLSDFGTQELIDELAERGEFSGDIDGLRLYDWLRDIPNVPNDIREMVYQATGRILP
jgi:hypothetical protein